MPIDFEHDERLDLLKPGQYRIWYDGQNILVPVGQSTTKPLTKEIVNTNTKVYGEIHNGYFQPPLVDFTNSNVYTERFDKYYLQTWRDELPTTDTRIDLHYDLGLRAIHIRVHLQFKAAEVGIIGAYDGDIILNWIDAQNWTTEKQHFDRFNLQRLKGDFFMSCNPTAAQRATGINFDLPVYLQNDNLPFTVTVTSADIINGISHMDILLKNPDFHITLDEFSFEILGGE